MEKIANQKINRRSLLKKGGLAAGALTVGAVMIGGKNRAFAQSNDYIPKGDIAILRFLAAAEILESDLWVQYAELGGIGDNPPIEIDPNQSLNNYQIALSNLDSDGPQYISSNTLDEQSHAAFLNAYLESKGAEPVDLEPFRTLPGSTATGSSGIKRLTNLMHLNVDTSWYVRYRSTTNPDFGATFPQAITITNRTAIPVSNADLNGSSAHIQVIANTAALRIYRTRRLETVSSNEPESQQSRSAENHAGNWRRRDRPLSGMGRFCGQWCAGVGSAGDGR